MSRGRSRAVGISRRVPGAWALTAVGVLVLVSAVAVASSGSTPSSTGAVRPPSRVLVDTFVSLGIVLVIPAIALLAYGLMQRKEIAREIASGRYPLHGLLTFILLMSVFTAVAYYRFRNWEPPAPPDPDDPLFPARPPVLPQPGASDSVAQQPEFAWVPVLIVVGIAALAVAAFVIAERRRRRTPELDEEAAATGVADALDDGLEDLRAEPDPRRAVIAAFARLERALGAVGLPRGQGETSEEYVTRVFDRLDVDRAPVRRLGELFAHAKFSQHTVDEAMKDEAIASLVQTRDELRALVSRRDEERVLARSRAAGEAVAS